MAFKSFKKAKAQSLTHIELPINHQMEILVAILRKTYLNPTWFKVKTAYMNMTRESFDNLFKTLELALRDKFHEVWKKNVCKKPPKYWGWWWIQNQNKQLNILSSSKILEKLDKQSLRNLKKENRKEKNILTLLIDCRT